MRGYDEARLKEEIIPRIKNITKIRFYFLIEGFFGVLGMV